MNKKVKLLLKNDKRNIKDLKKKIKIYKSKNNKDMVELFQDRIVYIQAHYNILAAENRNN